MKTTTTLIILTVFLLSSCVSKSELDHMRIENDKLADSVLVLTTELRILKEEMEILESESEEYRIQCDQALNELIKQNQADHQKKSAYYNESDALEALRDNFEFYVENRALCKIFETRRLDDNKFIIKCSICVSSNKPDCCSNDPNRKFNFHTKFYEITLFDGKYQVREVNY